MTLPRGVGKSLSPVLAVLMLAGYLSLSPAVAARASDPWTGSITSFAADSSTTTVNSPSTTVSVVASPQLTVGYQLSVYDELGDRVCYSSWASCSFTAIPPTNGTKSFTAYVAHGAPVTGPPVDDVRATGGPVTVTNTGWTGSFTSFAADSPTTNVNSPMTMVSVVASPQLAGGYQLSVYDELGDRVCYSSWASCSFWAGPATNGSKSFTAYVARGAPVTGPPVNDVRAMAGPVTVTNAGWTGSFTSFAADSPTTNASSPSTTVSVVASPQLAGGYQLSVYDELGSRMCYSSWASCSFTAIPPTNGSKSFTAYVARGAPVTGPPVNDVRATAGPVMVTSVGWSGHFTSAHATVGDQAFLGATSATFEWDQPLAFVRVDVIDSHGAVIGSCNGAGSLSCSAALALGPGESKTVHAEARALVPGGGYATVATSGGVDLAGMSSDAFARLLLDAPEASLVPLLGAARAEAAVEIRAAQQSETFCVALGTGLPSTAMFHSTVPDATLLCMSGGAALMGYLIGTMGVDLALNIMTNAADTDQGTGAVPDPEPSPQPQPDPIMPGGPNDPPATQVDTCQLPPGPDPEVFYFYQRDFQRVAIEQNGFVREVGEIGKIWVSNALYGTATEAQAYLSLPGEPPAGYYEIPAERLDDLFGPECVTAEFDQPGGGIQYWTTHSVDLGGLTWHTFP